MLNTKNNTIGLKLVYQAKEFFVYTNDEQYRTLMALISEQLGILGFGLCSGMGSCGSCLVEITENGSNKKRPALSCGISITYDLANSTILIPMNIY